MSNLTISLLVFIILLVYIFTLLFAGASFLPAFFTLRLIRIKGENWLYFRFVI